MFVDFLKLVCFVNIGFLKIYGKGCIDLEKIENISFFVYVCLEVLVFLKDFEFVVVVFCIFIFKIFLCGGGIVFFCFRSKCCLLIFEIFEL